MKDGEELTGEFQPATGTKPRYQRLINGGWQTMIAGYRLTFFRPTPGVPFKGVDFGGDWWCKMYLPDKTIECRATSREAGIYELVQMIREDGDQ